MNRIELDLAIVYNETVTYSNDLNKIKVYDNDMNNEPIRKANIQRSAKSNWH